MDCAMEQRQREEREKTLLETLTPARLAERIRESCGSLHSLELTVAGGPWLEDHAIRGVDVRRYTREEFTDFCDALRTNSSIRCMDLALAPLNNGWLRANGGAAEKLLLAVGYLSSLRDLTMELFASEFACDVFQTSLLQNVAELLPRLISLESFSLTLEFQSLSTSLVNMGPTLDVIADGLRNHPSLRRIRISVSHVDEGARARSLQYQTRHVRLDELFESCASVPKLESFCLSGPATTGTSWAIAKVSVSSLKRLVCRGVREVKLECLTVAPVEAPQEEAIWGTANCHLEVLDLEKVDFVGGSMHDVAYIIKHYGSGLLSVRFCSDSSQSANTAFTVEAMLQALTPLRSLTKLLFICERLPRRAVRVVCRLIRSQRSLVELELDCSSLYGPTAFTLAKVIRKNSSLETLRLRNGFLSKRACKALAGAICSSRSIRCVSWKRDLPYLLCPMPLLEYMSRDLCFKRLEFSGQDCRRPEVLAIARSLVHGSDLEELRLVDKGSNSCNVLLIGRALSVNDKLRSLSLNASQKCWHTDLLSENMEVYCEEFGAALANNRTLQNLQLCFCYISDIGCSSLSRGLMRNVCLATLDLSSNAIGDRGVGALADALRENSSLESLRLLDCRATDDGVGKLVDALYVNDRLKHLEVSQASYHLQHTDTSRVAGLSVYGEIVGRRVLNVLATNHSLQTLDLATCLPDYDIQRTYYLRLNQMGRHYLRNGASIGTTREAALRSIYKSIHDVDCIFFVVKTCAQDLFRSGTSREF